MWSEWEKVSNELLLKVYRKAKEMEEKELIKIVLDEIKRRCLIINENQTKSPT